MIVVYLLWVALVGQALYLAARGLGSLERWLGAVADGTEADGGAACGG